MDKLLRQVSIIRVNWSLDTIDDENGEITRYVNTKQTGRLKVEIIMMMSKSN